MIFMLYSLHAGNRPAGGGSRLMISALLRFNPSAQPQRHADEAHQQRHYPGNSALPEDDERGRASAQLTLDGGDRRHTGRIEQGEHQQGRRVSGS